MAVNMFSSNSERYKIDSFSSSSKAVRPTLGVGHTLYPTTSGTSVIGLVYDSGVFLVADTLGSYGSLARFKDIKRICKLTNKAVLACSGDIADFQFIREIIEQKVRDDECGGFTKVMDAKNLHCWMSRVLYNRRSRFDPLWLDCVIAGYHDDKPFLGFVDKIGTPFEACEIATGYGMHLALPIFRELREKTGIVTKMDAKNAINEVMKLLYYRDCRAHFKFQLADITLSGVEIQDVNIRQETNWSHALP